MIVTTESGSVYDLSNGFCVRNGQFRFKIWWVYCFDYKDGMPDSEIPQPFADEDAGKKLSIQLGKSMYLGGKDGWIISTNIVSIEGQNE